MMRARNNRLRKPASKAKPDTPQVGIEETKSFDIYDSYKPLRNQLRKLALEPSLQYIWEHQKRAHPQSGVIKVRVGPGNHWIDIYIWELLNLSREIVLHAAGNEHTLQTAEGLYRFIGLMRNVVESISKHETTNVVGNLTQRALHRLIHQQARWQNSRDEARLFRAYHVYSDPELAPLFERVTGLSVRSMYLQALAIGGASIKRAGTNALQDYSAFEVTSTERDAFFKISGTTVANLRETLNQWQCLDARWPYTFNPMEATPLVNIDSQQPHMFWCPLPGLLLRRFTEGLFYDLIQGKKELGIEFGHEYGHAFERYVGRVLHDVFDQERVSISAEQPYEVSGQTRHGVDWIVSDATANLFIECKTRRMSQAAKETGEGDALDKSLDEMAIDIVKLYANIDDVLNGISTWTYNGLPIYPIIVTYEDWYMLYPTIFERLIEFVKRRLESKGLPASWTESMPLFYTSIAELEMAAQDIDRLGIERFCSAGASRPHRHFQLSQLVHAVFPDQAKPHRRLLKNSWDEIFPKMKQWAGLVGQKDPWWTLPAER